MNGVNHPTTHIVDVNGSFNSRDGHNLFEGLVSVAKDEGQVIGQPDPALPFQLAQHVTTNVMVESVPRILAEGPIGCASLQSAEAIQ